MDRMDGFQLHLVNLWSVAPTLDNQRSLQALPFWSRLEPPLSSRPRHAPRHAPRGPANLNVTPLNQLD